MLQTHEKCKQHTKRKQFQYAPLFVVRAYLLSIQQQTLFGVSRWGHFEKCCNTNDSSNIILGNVVNPIAVYNLIETKVAKTKGIETCPTIMLLTTFILQQFQNTRCRNHWFYNIPLPPPKKNKQLTCWGIGPLTVLKVILLKPLVLHHFQISQLLKHLTVDIHQPMCLTPMCWTTLI